MAEKKTFTELVDEDIDYITVIYNTNIRHSEKIKILTHRFGVVGRTIRAWWAKLGLTKDNTNMPDQLVKARERLLDGDEEVLLITAAQNKTLVNKEFFRSLKAYRKHIQNELGKKCKIVIIPARYRNPVSAKGIKNYKPSEWWDASLDDYLYYYKMEFENALIAADVRIRPTAVNPLSGLEPLAGQGHLIVGHPRHQFNTLPRFIGDTLKTMSTTGFITRSNYTVSKSGAKGEVHHNYGFVVLEKENDGEVLVPRKVKVNIDGEFTDLVWNVKGDKVTRIEGSEGYVWGDIHEAQLDPRKYRASVRLMLKLKPKAVVFHDLLDGYSFNPHESKNTFLQRRKIVEGKYFIKDEVESAIGFLSPFEKRGYDVYVLRSNHDEFLDRYITNFDWKKDLHNSPAYLEYAKIQQDVDLREYGNILGYLIYREYGGKVKYVKYTEPLRILDYLNLHGEHGSNGARGSATTFRKLNIKMVHGHCHSPYMLDNVTAVGISAYLQQDYNSKGPSSWAFADNIYHHSGKNQLIVFNDNYKVSNLV